MSKTIHIDIFDPASIDAAVREIREYSAWVQRKTEELVKRLAEYGLRRVQVGYAAALYDVDKTQRDVVLTVEERGKNQYAIVAYGFDVLLLEFGSGVNGGGHPLNGEFGMGPGTFPGQTHVPTPGYWWYKGEDGKSHYSVGHPPSMTMYQTGKELRDRILEVAKEVFGT